MSAIKLEITLEDGRISVHGPIENAIFCVGLLDLAKDAIKDHANSVKNRIQPATLQFVK